MDPEQASQVLLAGGVFIFEQLPVGSEFGFDCVVHQVGQKFKGIKMIPPGLHFVHFSVRSAQGQLSPRAGFFAQFEAQQCLIKVFDPTTEELNDELITQDMRNKYQFSNLPYFDANLAPYALDKYRDWLRLSNHIDIHLLKDIQPLNGMIDCVSHQLPSNFVSSRQEGRKMDTTQGEDPQRCIRFTPIADRFFSHPHNCSASDLSEHSRDSSFTLQSLIESRSEQFVLGELQFSFVTFLLCHVYESFEQWKRLIRLFCHCRQLVRSNGQLFTQFISVLHYQMQHVPSDLFVDIVDSDNFLYRTLREFFENLAETDDNLDGQLVQRATMFKDHLSQKLGWDLDAELDDEAPVIVDDE